VLRIRTVSTIAARGAGEGYEVVVAEGIEVQGNKTIIARGPNGESCSRVSGPSTSTTDGYVARRRRGRRVHINYDDQILIDDGQEVTAAQLTLARRPALAAGTMGPTRRTLHHRRGAEGYRAGA